VCSDAAGLTRQCWPSGQRVLGRRRLAAEALQERREGLPGWSWLGDKLQLRQDGFAEEQAGKEPRLGEMVGFRRRILIDEA
jgi:hypothetical protein